MKNETKACNCYNQNTTIKKPTQPILKIKKTARAIPSAFTSVLIAFFPKCPLCWAVYMSMFSSIGLAQIPYMGWLLPVLLGFLLLHLWMLYRKTAQKGYVPFLISLVGCLLLITVRLFFPGLKWASFAAMACIISGSLLNNFITTYLPITFHKKLIIS